MNNQETIARRFDPETLPARIRALKVDPKRGYPVPWFVQWLPDAEGKPYPEFRVMDVKKLVRAVKERLCWVCGEKLGVYMTFVAGPMCGINRTNSEPPSHHECAEWSAKNCPFLTKPKMTRREDDLIDNKKLVETAAGVCLPRNPGVTMLWTTKSYKIFQPPGEKGFLIEMGEPEMVEWFREARPATQDEVLDSVESGLPSLKELAAQDDDPEAAFKDLRESVAKFMKYLPPE